MLLYIVRHAFAGQNGDPRYPDDALRPLTKKGRKRFSRMIKRLVQRDFAPELVASSPLVRCRQTADVICDRTGTRTKLQELESLAPGGPLEMLVAWSNEQGVEELAWVGHSPDVDRFVAALIGARDGAIVMAKGAVAIIQFEDEIVASQGELRGLATPKLLVS
jgi:phosphohistidine phosphatase